MTNKNKYLEDLSKKLSAEKFRDELNKASNMLKSKEVIPYLHLTVNG